jgi:hypothetical protein
MADIAHVVVLMLGKRSCEPEVATLATGPPADRGTRITGNLPSQPAATVTR